MAKPPKKPKRVKPEQIETEPDAWERFEKTIGKIVPPRRRESKKEAEARRNEPPLRVKSERE